MELTEKELEHQKDLERIKRLRLMDDEMMKFCFDGNIPAVEFTLRIILVHPDLIVKSVVSEEEVSNLYGRSVRFDVHAVDSTGREYDIEIQRADKGAGAKRARFNSALLDLHGLRPGQDHEALRDSYVIFITENDVLGKGYPVYHIERTIQEDGDTFQDGSHIIYVNGEYEGEDPIGALMSDFRQSDPKKMHEGPLKEIVDYTKNTEKGVSSMCRELEEMRKEAIEKGREEGALAMLKSLVKRGALPIADAAKELGVNEETFRKMAML